MPWGLIMLRWERKTNDGYVRFYEIHLGRDLLDDLILTCIWGRKGASNGAIVHHLVENEARAKTLIQDIGKTRQQKGYRLLAPQNGIPLR